MVTQPMQTAYRSPRWRAEAWGSFSSSQSFCCVVDTRSIRRFGLRRLRPPSGSTQAVPKIATAPAAPALCQSPWAPRLSLLSTPQVSALKAGPTSRRHCKDTQVSGSTRPLRSCATHGHQRLGPPQQQDQAKQRGPRARVFKVTLDRQRHAPSRRVSTWGCFITTACNIPPPARRHVPQQPRWRHHLLR